MTIQLLSYDQLREFFILCQRAAEYLEDENKLREYFKLKKEFEKEMMHTSEPSSVLVAAMNLQEFFAKHFAELHNPTEVEKRRAERLNKSFDQLQASLRDEMHLSPQQRANVKLQYQKSSAYLHGVNSDGSKLTFQKYLNYGVATNPKDIKTVVALDPDKKFQTYRQKNTEIVNKALSVFPPRATVHVVGLDHYGSWSPIRWLPHSLFGSNNQISRSAVGSGWKDNEALALAADLARKGFHIENLDKLPKETQQRIKMIEDKYEETMSKAEEDKVNVSEKPDISLGKRPNR